MLSYPSVSSDGSFIDKDLWHPKKTPMNCAWSCQSPFPQNLRNLWMPRWKPIIREPPPPLCHGLFDSRCFNGKNIKKNSPPRFPKNCLRSRRQGRPCQDAEKTKHGRPFRGGCRSNKARSRRIGCGCYETHCFLTGAAAGPFRSRKSSPKNASKDFHMRKSASRR